MVSKTWSDISSSTMCYPFVAFGNTSWHDRNICHRSPWQRMQPVLTKLLVAVSESNLHLSLISSTFTCLGFWKLMTTLMTCLTEDYVVTFHSVCFCILAKFENTAETWVTLEDFGQTHSRLTHPWPYFIMQHAVKLIRPHVQLALRQEKKVCNRRFKVTESCATTKAITISQIL